MKLTSLYSGSSGNCLLLQHNSTNLLIDAGLPGSRIQEMLRYTDVTPDELGGILVTHEHSDHVSGVGVLSRRFHLPIYTNESTLQAMRPKIGKIKDDMIRLFDTSTSFILNDMKITPFSTSHDAADSVGFHVTDGQRTLAIATDIGIVTEDIESILSDCQMVFLEANHDVDMLMNGPYPFYLKQRILSEVGHLSNEAAGNLVCSLIQSGVSQVMLGHLSQHNNTPVTAFKTVEKITQENDIMRDEDYRLYVALRERSSDTIEL